MFTDLPYKLFSVNILKFRSSVMETQHDLYTLISLIFGVLCFVRREYNAVCEKCSRAWKCLIMSA